MILGQPYYAQRRTRKVREQGEPKNEESEENEKEIENTENERRVCELNYVKSDSLRRNITALAIRRSKV